MAGGIEERHQASHHREVPHAPIIDYHGLPADLTRGVGRGGAVPGRLFYPVSIIGAYNMRPPRNTGVTEPLPRRNYPRAPIVEAVIQILVAAPTEPPVLERIAHKLKGIYPNSEPLQEFKIEIANTGGQIGVAQNPQGFRLANNDQTDILLINPRGITAARLAPYPNWQHLRDKANAAWQEWKDATPRHPIARLGVRYINRIDVPQDPAEPFKVQDYLNFYRQATPITGEPMLGYLLQIVVPTFVPSWTATVTTTPLGDSQVPNHASVLLDIDVMRTAEIPLNDAQLWPVIDQARAIKNDIFERCITDASRRLFQS